jgi:5-methylcytosine-specific restriction endonuclease McrA
MRDINEYLKPWGSLRSNRSGMLNSSMAKALAPFDRADKAKYRTALELLDQNASNLRCVYCNDEAAEWDHLVPIMRGGVPTGHGHTFGNLVPACASCNREKLVSEWDAFLKRKAGPNYATRKDTITRYAAHFKPQTLPR